MSGLAPRLSGSRRIGCRHGKPAVEFKWSSTSQRFGRSCRIHRVQPPRSSTELRKPRSRVKSRVLRIRPDPMRRKSRTTTRTRESQNIVNHQGSVSRHFEAFAIFPSTRCAAPSRVCPATGSEPTFGCRRANEVERPEMAGGLNRSRGRGYGLTLKVRERPVTRLYVGE
jgi:hypothetical protein